MDTTGIDELKQELDGCFHIIDMVDTIIEVFKLKTPSNNEQAYSNLFRVCIVDFCVFLLTLDKDLSYYDVDLINYICHVEMTSSDVVKLYPGYKVDFTGIMALTTWTLDLDEQLAVINMRNNKPDNEISFLSFYYLEAFETAFFIIQLYIEELGVETKAKQQMRTNVFYDIEAATTNYVYEYFAGLIENNGLQLQNTLNRYADRFNYDPVRHVCRNLKYVDDNYLKATGSEDASIYEYQFDHNCENDCNQSEPSHNQNSKNDKIRDGDDPIDELNALIGLRQIKQDISSLVNLIKVRKMREQRGMKQSALSLHMVFTGNPGTGKTTVARIIAKIYKELGILSTGQLIEVDRGGLVAGYTGQTAIKVDQVIDSAIGGVLFIDEAYSLMNGEDDFFGKEAIDTLLKDMEDHRDNLVVIVAGYPNLMHKFLDSNPGLRSRFNRFFEFEDYTPDELLQILELTASKEGYKLSDDAITYSKKYFEDYYNNRDEHYANGRDVRNYFEKALMSQANRIVSLTNCTDDDLITLTVDDFKEHL